MSYEEEFSLSQFTEKLFKINIDFDKKRSNSQSIINKVKAKYEPRAEFNRWRKSQDGQLWKKQQYQKQKDTCAICNQKIMLKGSHIDHIKPLSIYPDLALDISNLQITCWQCNIYKGDK